MAHALNNYEGDCRHIHGHSYELHVTVTAAVSGDNYISPPGVLIDFKNLKKLVNESIVKKFDHRIILSRSYAVKNPSIGHLENVFLIEAEPSAENLLIYSKSAISEALPAGIRLYALRLFETKGSYAEWIANPSDLII